MNFNQIEGQWVKAATGILGGIVSFLWGGIPQALITLFALACIDYVSGIIASGKNGLLSSRVGNRGIPGKVLIFMVVAVAHLLDQTLSDGHMLRDAMIAFYIANEVISIIENIGRAGVPVPDVIRKAIAVLSDKGNDDQRSDKNE